MATRWNWLLPLALVAIVGIGAIRYGNSGQADTAGPGADDMPLVRAVVTQPVARLTLPLEGQEALAGDWIALGSLPWEQASTGWLVLADDDTPVHDMSFVYGPLVVSGQTYQRGISTYPFSDVRYPLDGQVLRFSAVVGITDDSANSMGSVRFFVYGDEFLLHKSGVVAAAAPAQLIDVSVEGLQSLRLVVDDAGDGSLGDYALWAEPRLLRSIGPPRPAVQEAIAAARAKQADVELDARTPDRVALGALAERDRALVRRALGAVSTSNTSGAFDPGTATLVLANDQIIASLGAGGLRNGRLSVQRRDADLPTLVDVSPSVTTQDGQKYRLRDLRAERVLGDDVRRTAAPPGRQVVARYRLPGDRGGLIVVQLTVLDGSPALELQVTSVGVALRQVQYLDPLDGAIVLGDDVAYLTDRSHLYQGKATADGHVRRAPLEATKPALLWSETAGQGMLLTFNEYVASPAWLSLERHPGRLDLSVGLSLEALLHDFGPSGTSPPTLRIELTSGPVGHQTFAAFRGEAGRRYPSAPFPSYARYQWGSWYTYGPGVSAAGLQRQMNLLVANFTDLGPWLFAIDAGWYVQYGRSDAELTTVDRDKFPQGVRGVADAAHALGMNVILYLGTGFVHDSTADGGEWLALKGFIDRYPQWLVPFQCPDGVTFGHGRMSPTPISPRGAGGNAEDPFSPSGAGTQEACVSPSGVHRYLLDYANPEVRAYLAGIIRDFFLEHGADGILLDGVADAEGQLIPRLERDTPTGPRHPLLPTLDLYRFIREEADRHRPGAFIESGWLHPRASDPYIDVFWYGDDLSVTDGAYPFAGFIPRLDYALFSRLALGQRPYVGTGSGDPTDRSARWRIQAAAALGAHASISYDLGQMSPATVGAFRADLVALDPFTGVTTFGPGIFPETFATTRDGVTYLGLLNRAYTQRTLRVPTRAHQLSGPRLAFTVDTGTARLVDGDFDVEVPARSFRLLVLRAEPGVVWTDSVVAAGCGGPQPPCAGGLELTASGPPQVPGFAFLVTPPPTSVSIDGIPVSQAATPSATTYAYDVSSGLLSLSYAHTVPGRGIAVRW